MNISSFPIQRFTHNLVYADNENLKKQFALTSQRERERERERE